MFQTSYMGDDINARAFLTLGAGGLSLAAASVMSYYASSDDDYRYGYFKDETTGEIPLWGDLRFLVAASSMFLGPALYMRGMMMAASAVGILGAGSIMSLASSEGQRWSESGQFLGITLPALPAMPGSEPAQIEAAPIAAVA